MRIASLNAASYFFVCGQHSLARVPTPQGYWADPAAAHAHDHETHSGHGSDEIPPGHHDVGDCHLSADGFEALSFQSAQPFAVQRFQDFLEGLPDNVYRGKGLLWIAESDKCYVFHLVAGRFSLDVDAGRARAGNKLVLIGRNLDRAELRSRLEACLTPAALV
jgi:G3E family GTPase